MDPPMVPVYHKVQILPPEQFCPAGDAEDPYTHPATGARLANLVYQIKKVGGDGDARRKLQGLVDGCQELPGSLMVLEATDRFAFVASLKTPHLVSWTIARGTQTPVDVGVDLMYLLTGRTHANPHAKDLLTFHDRMCEMTEHNPALQLGYTVNPSLSWTCQPWRESRKPLVASTFNEAVDRCNARSECIGFQESRVGTGFELIKEGASYGPGPLVSYAKPRGFVRMAAGHSKGGAEVTELGRVRRDVTVHSFNSGGVNNLRDLFRSRGNVTAHKICGDAVSAMMIPIGVERYYAPMTHTAHPHSSKNFLPPPGSAHITRTTSILTTRLIINQHHPITAPSAYILVAAGDIIAAIISHRSVMPGLMDAARFLIGHPLYTLVSQGFAGGLFDWKQTAIRFTCEVVISRAQVAFSGPKLAVIVITLHAVSQLLTHLATYGKKDLKHYLANTTLPSLKRATASYIGGSVGATIGFTIGSIIPLPLAHPIFPKDPVLKPYVQSTCYWASSLLLSVTGRTLGAMHTPEWVAVPYMALLLLSVL